MACVLENPCSTNVTALIRFADMTVGFSSWFLIISRHGVVENTTQVRCVGRLAIIHHTIVIGLHSSAHGVRVMYVQVYRTDVLYILDWWCDFCTDWCVIYVMGW